VAEKAGDCPVDFATVTPQDARAAVEKFMDASRANVEDGE
jgi:hypothetical protein